MGEFLLEISSGFWNINAWHSSITKQQDHLWRFGNKMSGITYHAPKLRHNHIWIVDLWPNIQVTVFWPLTIDHKYHLILESKWRAEGQL